MGNNESNQQLVTLSGNLNMVEIDANKWGVFENVSDEIVQAQLKIDGDFLVMKPKPFGFVTIAVKWNNRIKYLMPYFDGKNFGFGDKLFENCDELLTHHFKNKIALGGSTKPVLKRHIKHDS